MAALLLTFASLSSAAGAQGLWAEAEHYSDQAGSQRPDRPPHASGGECLGSNFGGARRHYVAYRFELHEPIVRPHLLIRYARQAEGPAEFAVSLDGAEAASVTFPPTGGWGHISPDEWSWAVVQLRSLASGIHTLRLTCLGDKHNTNIDGFLLGGPGAKPPGPEAIADLTRLIVDRRDRAMNIDPDATIAEFAPVVEDIYYPPDEPLDPSGLGLPVVTELREASAVVIDDAGEAVTVSPGETWQGWRLLAITQAPPAGVFERRLTHSGWLVYVGESGPSLTIRLPVGSPEAAAAEPLGYPPDYAEAVIASQDDVLAERVLAQGEPSHELASGLLPELVAYVPISGPAAEQKLVIDGDGRIGYLTGDYGPKSIAAPLFDPADWVGDLFPSTAKRGLLDGWLPGVHYAFVDTQAKDGWEQIAFTSPEPELTHVALIEAGGWRFFTLVPHAEHSEPSRFFEALAAFHVRWSKALRPAMRVDFPERRLLDASRGAVARSMTTFVGLHPKYGLGHYAMEQHDGFPPTILWMANACLEWGLDGKARDYLTYYFGRFVRDDGTFDYYGPAGSEYGQMLDCVTRLIRYADDRAWLDAHRAKIDAMADHLIDLRRESLTQPRDAATFGLLFGSPEADTRKDTDYYFSGTAWAARGLTELARLYRDLGAAPRADELQGHADELRAATVAQGRAALIDGVPPFLPPYPGTADAFPTMTSDQLASYTNYRYWPELLSSGVLTDALEEAVFEYRRRMGGELMATTRFSGHLDDWPQAHQAHAFLAADRIDPFLLGLYGHIALQQMPGTFCAYEQVGIRGDGQRSYHADYCVPAQLTTPLMVKWMLVFDGPDDSAIWLCKGVPRRWLAPGQSFSVRHAPTRIGPLSLRVESTREETRVSIALQPHAQAKLLLRVRRPGGELPIRVLGDGREVTFDVEREVVVLPSRESLEVVLQYE